jgi:hypothetical protein
MTLGGWEMLWRARGWTPTVEAEQEAWVLARMRVKPTSTVLAGSSRIAAAVDPSIWAATLYTDAPVMLAAEGVGALPVLANLASDEQFRGHLVLEMMPVFSYTRDAYASGPLRGNLAAYREAQESPARRWEAWLRVHVPSHFVFRRPELLPQNYVPALMTGRRMRQRHNGLRADQFRPIDFRRDGFAPNRPQVMDTSQFRQIRRWNTPATGATLDSLLARISEDVARLQQRGGTVTFVALQGCGGRRIVETALFPKPVYWERLRAIPGVRLIDSDDVPEIAGLPCYDGSHVDERDTPLVTARLAQLATKR